MGGSALAPRSWRTWIFAPLLRGLDDGCAFLVRVKLIVDSGRGSLRVHRGFSAEEAMLAQGWVGYSLGWGGWDPDDGVREPG